MDKTAFPRVIAPLSDIKMTMVELEEWRIPDTVEYFKNVMLGKYAITEIIKIWQFSRNLYQDFIFYSI